jgi:tRNA (guanine-N7-)-methyltransferase
MLDPKDFIIVRKRKKYRFAKFANSPLCFEFDEWDKQPVDSVEIGAGNGLFSVELAARHPELQFVALDVKGDRLQRGAYEAEERGITNVRFVRARADQILEMFDRGSLTSVWVTFPDPFPRKKSAGRRLTHPTFLAKYKELLDTNGALYLKHDNRDFFHWSLEQLVGQRWNITELSFDLHDSELDQDYKILTTYEQRWLSEGLVTNFVKAVHS